MCGLFAYSGDLKEIEGSSSSLETLRHRGPDATEVMISRDGPTMAFHRLAIMDTSSKGHQPFVDTRNGNMIMCNGEIYNFKKLKSICKKSYEFRSNSDCEVLVPLYEELGMEKLCQALDAEFAIVVWDKKKGHLLAGRDPIGIRPLFYGYTEKNKIMLASEMKAILTHCKKAEVFPPGHFFNGKSFVKFADLTTVTQYRSNSMDSHLEEIREKLIEGVRKRLDSDVPVGFLLSGGLDSSLVCAIATKLLNQQITTFSVGLDHHPIDIPYARAVASHINSQHHEVFFGRQDTIEVLEDLIWHLETWDITTIRASIGMYLVCKHIREKTPIKVVLTGEISDELFGYKYTDFAPSPEAFQEESKKRVDELHMYDVLRADRCIAAHSLEARVPFGDLDFVRTVMSIDPALKMNTTGIGKYLLRKAFQKDDILPESILWRDKAAFSDAVGHSMVDYLKEYAEGLYDEKDLIMAKEKYPYGTPFTKESLLYRDIFEKHFKGQAHMIKDFWMPNKTWKNCDVLDPSARILPNYGKSGV